MMTSDTSSSTTTTTTTMAGSASQKGDGSVSVDGISAETSTSVSSALTDPPNAVVPVDDNNPVGPTPVASTPQQHQQTSTKVQQPHQPLTATVTPQQQTATVTTATAQMIRKYKYEWDSSVHDEILQVCNLIQFLGDF